MNNAGIKELKILDCTIRDGGYVNNWFFDKRVAREIYRALSKAGIDYMEIGFRCSEKFYDNKKFGIWKISQENHIREVTSNICGAKLALMADCGQIEAEDFCDAKESMVELIRIAVHKDKIKDAVLLLEKIKEKGYAVSLNAMGYTNYTESERNYLIDLLKRSELDYIYIADSFGSIFPNQIQSLIEPFLNIPDIKVGFHPHNSLQMAFANTLEAIRCGVHIIDSTIYGMGRAAGNLPTEIILSYLEREKGNKYNPISILNIIDKYFVAMRKKETWGYQLPYMLSGMFKCHPNYAKALVDMKEYTIEDIWKTMEYIKEKNPIGFSKELLNNVINEGIVGRLVKDESVDQSSNSVSGNLLQSGFSDTKVSYIDRYKNRDFLVLANGASLKQFQPKIEKFITKYDPVILGGNYLGGLFVPHYHAFNNKRRFTEYIESVSKKSKLLLGQYISEEMIREYTDSDYERIYYKDLLSSNFEIIDGVIQANCRTIAVLLLGVAIVMGARRIFAAGMDGYVGIDTKFSHFYMEPDEQEDNEMIIERHRWCQTYIEQIDDYLCKRGNEGLHIITPTSYKSEYKGIENYL